LFNRYVSAETLTTDRTIPTETKSHILVFTVFQDNECGAEDMIWKLTETQRLSYVMFQRQHKSVVSIYI
jgi:hypothetical protein